MTQLASKALPTVAAALSAGTTDSSAAAGEGRGTNSARRPGEAAAARYWDQVHERVQAALRYPRRARRSVLRIALVRARIDRAGRLVACEIVEKSGSGLIDRDACATFERAAPFGSTPASFSQRDLEFDMPLEYSPLAR